LKFNKSEGSRVVTIGFAKTLITASITTPIPAPNHNSVNELLIENTPQTTYITPIIYDFPIHIPTWPLEYELDYDISNGLIDIPDPKPQVNKPLKSDM
jgi:hypothetical protein